MITKKYNEQFFIRVDCEYKSKAGCKGTLHLQIMLIDKSDQNIIVGLKEWLLKDKLCKGCLKTEDEAIINIMENFTTPELIDIYDTNKDFLELYKQRL